MLPLLERLLALEPDSFNYRALQASAYNLLGHNERALRIHERMLTEFPESELLWLYYGHTLRARRTARARRSPPIAKSELLKPQFGEAWYSLANLKTVHFSEEDIADDAGAAGARGAATTIPACSSSSLSARRSRMPADLRRLLRALRPRQRAAARHG